MAVETRDIVPVLCPGCGGHLCDRTGSHFMLRSDSRQLVLVPTIEFIRCQRRIVGPDGEKTRCNTYWKP